MPYLDRKLPTVSARNRLCALAERAFSTFADVDSNSFVSSSDPKYLLSHCCSDNRFLVELVSLKLCCNPTVVQNNHAITKSDDLLHL